MDLCVCLALRVGCIVCVFKMDDYIGNMDKEREKEGGDGYVCSSSIAQSGVLNSSSARTYPI